jgi:hypothetical protein
MVLMAVLLLAACGTPTTEAPSPLPPPTETLVVVPTNTAPPVAPTATPPPANTPTPEPPTATPTLAATATATVPPTPDPNEGVGDVIYSDALAGTGGWNWTFDDEAASFGISREQGQLNTIAKKSNTWRFVISPDTLRFGDQQIQVNVRTNVCAEKDEYALLFRGSVDAEGNYSFYAFKLRCDGSARLDLLRGQDTFVIADWTKSEAIKSGAEADNALTVWAGKDQLRFYVNDQYVVSATDNRLTTGFYGFYLNDRTNGNMSVSWKNLEVRAVAAP